MKKTYAVILFCITFMSLSIAQNKPFTKISENTLQQEIEVPIYKRVKVSKNIPNYFDKLIEAGVDLNCGAVHTNDYILLELSEIELNSLTSFGLNYTVEVENLTEYYSNRFQNDLPKMQADLATEKSKSAEMRAWSTKNTTLTNLVQHDEATEINFPTPQNFTIPSTFGGCLTYAGVAAELDKMRAKYPHLISTKANISPTNQLTHQGRPIYFVKISDNPNANESEPQVLYNGMMHSREVASMMNLIYYMWYLLENYESDPSIKNLLNNSELYFVPVANPDGLVWNETITPNGGGMQRKNRRLGVCSTSTGAVSTTNTFDGIDLNRNFGYNWGLPGSSTDPCTDTYRGASGFSENETQMFRDFVLSKDFLFSNNHHAYANLNVHSPTTNGRIDEYFRWNHDMNQYNRYIYGPVSILTVASGDVNQWLTGGPADAQGNVGSGMDILSTAPENGNLSEGGFWPTTALLSICKRALRPNLVTAFYATKFAKLNDLTQSNITSLNSNLTFGIERLGQTAGNFTLTVTPVSSNIQSITSPSTQTGMAILEQRNVTASLVLNNTIAANDKIEYKVSLSNGDYVLYETNIVKYYNPTVIFSHNPDSSGLTGWTGSTAWATSTSAYSGTTSLTDASGAYANNLNKTLTTSSNYNLTSTGKVLIQYFAKWDLERNFDFVQIQGSTDGTTWTPLVGKYTKPLASSATNTANNNKPNLATSGNFQTAQGISGGLYDGDSMDKWVMEEIVIDSQHNSFLIGATAARFRFVLRSDADNAADGYSTTFDGFYFDDFKIIRINDNGPVAICKNANLNLDSNGSLTVLPADIDNGSYDDTAITLRTVTPNTFDCSHLGTTQEVTLTVTDASGQTSSCKSTIFISSSNTLVATNPTIVYHNKFNATWNTFCGALDYYLDVSTYPIFDEETIVSWTFATNTTTATTGTTGNTTKTITETATGSTTTNLGYATATGWDSGNGTKSWNINFSTLGKKNIKVSSKQYSASAGPKDFKLQYSLNNSTWNDVIGSTNIVLAANNTAGILNNVQLPAACDNQANVYLRWIMTSNIRVTGGTTTVANTGESRIDDIVIKATPNAYLSGYENLDVNNVTSYEITGLTPNTTYYYRVRAGKSTLLSNNSNTISVTTGGTPVIWDGNAWTNVTGPTATIGGIIQGNYSTASNGTFTANTLTIDSGNFVLNSNTAITVVNEFTNNASAANFIIQNNANFIQTNDLDNTGNTIVRRNSSPMIRLDYTGWSSPVSNQNLLDFSPLTLTNRFYTYNALNTANGAYETINPSINTFSEAKGFLIRTPNNWNATIATSYPGEFEGTLHNGRANISVNKGATTGYNFIGNPYASTISANSFIDANVTSTGSLNQRITGTLYFWTHTTPSTGSTYPLNNYATYTKLGGTPAANSSVTPNGTIQVGQAFMVNAATTGNVSFINSMRTSDFNNQFFRNNNQNVSTENSEPYKYRLNLNIDNNQVSQQLIGYTSNATNGIDAGYDGELLYNQNSISFYSLINNQKFAIQAKGMPFTTTDIVPLGFNAPITGNYSISIVEYDTFFNDKEVYLKDNTNNSFTNLKTTPYSFTTSIGEHNNRFEIHYTNTSLSNDDVSIENLEILKYDTKIFISSNEIMNGIEIYDIVGKLLYSNKTINAKSIELENENFKNQLLIVKINTYEKQIVKKVL